MLPPIFYASPEAIDENLITLDKDESHHAVNVLRLSPPSIVMVVDGFGTAFRGEIIDVKKNKVTVKIHSTIRNFGESNTKVILAAGLSTSSKFDTIIQKGTELGINRFVPLITEKSKIRIDEPKKAASKVKRLQKIALSAIKQCRRSYCPEISVPVTISQYLQAIDPDDIKLIFHPDKNSIFLDNTSILKNSKRVHIMIGPESGFSEYEIEKAVNTGFKAVSLGKRILRSETAGTVTAALIMYLLDELR